MNGLHTSGLSVKDRLIIRASALALIALIASLLCIPLVQDGDSDAEASGTCGDNLTWTLEGTALTISGTGEMYDFSRVGEDKAPWGEGVTSLTIERGVTSIGKDAFYGCFHLSSVELPETLASIGEESLMLCGFSSIILPESLTSIGDGAFWGCDELTGITIPAGVVELGEDVFRDCTGLESISVDQASAGYASVDGVLFDHDLSTLIAYPCARAGSTYTVPGSVASISSMAFGYTVNLHDIVIGAGVSYIDHNAFYYGGSIQSITVDGSNGYYSSSDGVLYDKDGTTLRCYPASRSATTFIIPEGVTRIAMIAFQQCNCLEKVIIPDSVIEIESDAFLWSESIQEVSIGNSVSEIGNGAFAYCTGLKEISIPDSVSELQFLVFNHCSSLSSVEIGDGVKAISYGAFFDCPLTRINFGSALEYVDPDAFTGISFHDSDGTTVLESTADNLRGNLFTGTDGYLIKGDGHDVVPENACGRDLVWSLDGTVLTISGTGDMYDYALTGDGVAPWGRGITAVTIGEGAISVGACAFYACRSLVSVTLPDTLISIGDEGFMACGFSSIVLPDSLESIGDDAFRSCSSLCDVRIPANVKNISDSAFRGCRSLVSINADPDSSSYASIDGVLFDKGISILISYPCAKAGASYVLPASVTSVSEFAFAYSSHLENLSVGAGVSDIGMNAFEYCRSLRSLSVDASNQVYSSSDGVLYDKLGSTLICYPASHDGTSFSVPGTVTVIGYRAFAQCKYLEAVVMSDSLNEIGSTAFLQCTALKEVSIPSSVSSIGHGAFWGCTSLQDIVIPNSVGSIPSYAFYGCTSLSTVVISDGVGSISRNAFVNCPLTSIRFGSGLEDVSTGAFGGITFYDSDGNTELAATAENLRGKVFTGGNGKLYEGESHEAVNSCGENLIWSLDGTALAISGTGDMYDYDRFGDDAAPWGSDITSVAIEDGVTSVGSNAFYMCSSLTSVSLPDSLVSIGDSAFMSSGIVEIRIPGNVVDIGGSAFGNCRSLKGIVVDDSNTVYASSDGVLFDKVLSTLIVYPPAKPDRSYDIPDSVTSIGYQAFSFSSNIEELTIGASVSSIDRQALAYTSSLRSITVDPSSTSYRSVDGILYDKGMSVLLCYPATHPGTSFEFPDTVTSIGYRAFGQSSFLQSIVIPDSVTDIGDWAFASCLSLRSVDIGDHVGSMGRGAFWNCLSLESVTIPDSVESVELGAFYRCSSLSTVVIGDGVASISGNAFAYCPLTSIRFGSALADVSERAFIGSTFFDSDGTTELAPTAENLRGCYFSGSDGRLVRGDAPEPDYSCGEDLTWSLDGTTLIVSGTGEMYDYDTDDAPWGAGNKDITEVVIGDGVTSVGAMAFNDCSNLVSVTLPETLTSIGMNAFALTGLISIELPGSLREIGNGAFSNCHVLVSASLPDSLEDLGYAAFMGCSSMVSFDTGDGVTSLLEDVLCDCYSLRVISLGVSVRSVDPLAITWCDSLQRIEVAASNAYLASLDGVLFTKDLGELIKYPQGRADSSYAIPEGTASIAERAFLWATGLGSVHIPSSISSIGEAAFGQCSGLSSILLDDSNAVYSSSDGVLFTKDMKTLVAYPAKRAGDTYAIPDSVGSIAPLAFSACDLVSVTIPDSVTVIGEAAFVSSPRLASVVIPGSVSVIPSEAFEECSSLESVTISDGVRSIGDWAFDYSPIHGELVIPDSVVSIGDWAFETFDGVQKVSFGTGISEIGDWAFGSTTFYDTDGTTELDHSAASLAGRVFTGGNGTLYSGEGHEAAVFLAVNLGEGVSATYNGEELDSGDKVPYGAVIKVTVQEKEGFVSHLYPEISDDGTYTVRADVWFDPGYAAIRCTVVFAEGISVSVDGNALESGDDVPYGTVLTVSLKDGYDGTITPATVDGEYKAVSDVSFEFVSSEIYRVIYVYGTTTAEVEVPVGSHLVPPEDSAVDGCRTVWYIDGAAVDTAEYEVTGDTIAIARYLPGTEDSSDVMAALHTARDGSVTMMLIASDDLPLPSGKISVSYTYTSVRVMFGVPVTGSANGSFSQPFDSTGDAYAHVAIDFAAGAAQNYSRITGASASLRTASGSWATSSVVLSLPDAPTASDIPVSDDDGGDITVVYVYGTTAATVRAASGSILDPPAEAERSGYSIQWYVDGDAVDPLRYRVLSDTIVIAGYVPTAAQTSDVLAALYTGKDGSVSMMLIASDDLPLPSGTISVSYTYTSVRVMFGVPVTGSANGSFPQPFSTDGDAYAHEALDFAGNTGDNYSRITGASASFRSGSHSWATSSVVLSLPEISDDPAAEAAENLEALEARLEGMRSAGEDYPMLMILGNADWDSDIDEKDVAYIENLLRNGYDYAEEFMADANHDGLIDEKDIAMVKQLMDYNHYKSKVNYLNVDYKIRTYDMSRPLHLAGCLTQTFEIECILAPEAVVATDYRCGDPSRNGGEGTYWQEFASVIDYDRMGTVGNLKFPDRDTIIEACQRYGNGDLVVWMNSEYTRGTGELEDRVAGTGVQILRLPSGEDGPVVNGVLTAGYLFHKFDRATAWADWYNGWVKGIEQLVAAVPEADEKSALGGFMYTSDEDSTPYYLFSRNSGEYRNLLRLGIHDVGSGIGTDSGLVGMTDEQLVSVCQKYGCDVVVGTVPGPFGSVYMDGSKSLISQAYLEGIYRERMDGMREAGGDVDLVVFGWQWATGPMELTFLAEVGNYLYDLGLDVEQITNEGMMWLGIYGESGDYKYTYDSLEGRFWYDGSRYAGGDAFGRTVTVTTSSNDNLLISYSSDDLSDFTVTLGTSDSGATTVTVALADSVASSYSSYRWTLYQVIENSSTTYDYPVAKKPNSSNPLATTSDPFAIWTLGRDDTGSYKFVVSCYHAGGSSLFSSGTEYTITLNITDLGTYTDTENVTKEMSWSYDGHAYTTTVTYDISEYTKYAQFNGASYTARSSFDDLMSFIVVNDVVTDITDDLASKYTATYSSEASGQSFAEFILAFVQCVFSYEYDDYLYGPDEYYAFPMETIQNQGGDCEDTSILAAVLFKSAGYSAGVFLVPEHCIAAVALDSYTAGSVASVYRSQVALFSYTYTDGKTYYGCETTLDENLYGIGWISRTYSIDSDGEVYYTTTDMFGRSTTTNKVVSDGKTVTYKSLGYGFHPATA